MNLMRIPAHAMLGVSLIWMEDDVLCGELAAHPLGSAAVGELEVVHGRVATALDQRRQMERHLTELTERIAGAAGRFARKGRALFGAFEVLADFTDDPALEARFRQLKTLFFPIGLRIFQRTHLEGTGAVEVLRKQVTPALMDELSSITLAGRTLADLYREWAEAAHELGRYLHQRTRTREALRRQGSKAASVDTKAARAEWVRFVRMLLSIADMVRLSQAGRERLLGPILRAVMQAQSSSTTQSSEADEVIEAPADPISESIAEAPHQDGAEDIGNVRARAVNGSLGGVTHGGQRPELRDTVTVHVLPVSEKAKILRQEGQEGGQAASQFGYD